MKFSIYIDQLTLNYWKGVKVGEGKKKNTPLIDATDALIIGFIQDLNPDNPQIKKKMWRGYFRINLSWLKEGLPILNIGNSAIAKHLRKLTKHGILKCTHRTIKGEGIRMEAYYKLSEYFWKIHAKQHKAVTDALEKSRCTDATGEKNPRVPEDTGREFPVESEANPRVPEDRNESIRDSLGDREREASSPASIEESGESPKDPGEEPEGEQRLSIGEEFRRMIRETERKKAAAAGAKKTHCRI